MLGALALLFLLLLILQLVIVFSGVYQKKVRDLIGPEENAEFEQAVKMERVYVGKYILYPKGAGTRALQTEDLVWGYAMQEPLVVSKYRWPVALYDREKHLTQIYFMEQKHCKEFLNAVAAQGYPFRIGYSSAMAEQFQENYPGFLADAEKEAKERQSEQTDG